MEVRNFFSGLSDRTVRTVACAAGLLLLTSAGCFVYLRLRRRGHPPPTELHQAAAHDLIMVPEEPVDEPGVLQVTETNLQLLFELLPEESALIMLSWTGELSKTTFSFQCLSGDSYCSKSESMGNGRFFLCLGRGSEMQLWYFSITETCRVNHLGFTYYTTKEISITGIQRLHGQVSELISYHQLDTFINIPLEDCVQTFHEVTRHYLRVQPDGRVISHQWKEEDTFCTPDCDSESQFYEESEMSFTPEEIEVPFISSHLADSGITDVFLKLQALREAFSTILTNVHMQNLLFLAGKSLVKHLAAANKKDVVEVQLAYESLIRFLRSSSNLEAIKAELLVAEVQHFNFLDVVFELVFFRFFMSDSLPEISDGGLLEQLFLMMKMWDTESWEPAAEQLFALLILQVLSFLGMIFSQPDDLYSDPAALSTVVLDLLKEQVQVLMKTIKEI